MMITPVQGFMINGQFFKDKESAEAEYIRSRIKEFLVSKEYISPEALGTVPYIVARHKEEFLAILMENPYAV